MWNKSTWQRTSVLVTALVVLVGTGQAPGRSVKDFDYKFDKDGEVHGFTANEGCRIAWHKGGAGGSAGCMKITGGHASVDSAIATFKAADNIISFDYLVHGSETLRLRVNVTGAENVKKYSRFGNYILRRVKQDTWLHAEVKLVDIQGMGEAKPKAYPELQYRSISFMTMEAVGEGAYVLIDNVRMGKPAPGVVKVLLDFEDEAEVKKLRPDEDAQLTVSQAEAGASSGKKSLKMVCKAGQQYVTFWLDPALLKGWDKFKYLAMDFHTAEANTVNFYAEIMDAASTNYQTRCTWSDNPIKKPKTTVLLDLTRNRRNANEDTAPADLKPQDKVDLAKLTRFKGFFMCKDLKADYVVHLDNVRLLTRKPAPVKAKAPPPKAKP